MAIETKVTGLAEYGQWMKVLLCGDPGSGKTMTSSTFPNPYFISAEGGLMSIARRFLPYTELNTTDDLREMLKILRQEPDVRAEMLNVPGRIDTVVIDTIDEVQKLFMRERVALTGKDNFVLQDYGWLGERMEGAIRAFRNLPMNVVFTCHLKQDKDEESGTIAHLPGLVGRTAGYLPGAVDLGMVLLSRTETTVVEGKSQKNMVRYAQTYFNSSYPWVKDRSGRLPAEFPINFEDDYDRMFELIYGGIAEEFEKLTASREKPATKKKAEKRPDPFVAQDKAADAEAEAFASSLQAK